MVRPFSVFPSLACTILLLGASEARRGLKGRRAPRYLIETRHKIAQYTASTDSSVSLKLSLPKSSSKSKIKSKKLCVESAPPTGTPYPSPAPNVYGKGKGKGRPFKLCSETYSPTYFDSESVGSPVSAPSVVGGGFSGGGSPAGEIPGMTPSVGNSNGTPGMDPSTGGGGSPTSGNPGGMNPTFGGGSPTSGNPGGMDPTFGGGSPTSGNPDGMDPTFGGGSPTSGNPDGMDPFGGGGYPTSGNPDGMDPTTSGGSPTSGYPDGMNPAGGVGDPTSGNPDGMDPTTGGDPSSGMIPTAGDGEPSSGNPDGMTPSGGSNSGFGSSPGGLGTGDSNRDANGNLSEEACAAIQERNASIDHDSLQFWVDFVLIINVEKDEVLQSLEDYLQETIGVSMAGCKDQVRAQQLNKVLVENVVFDVLAGPECATTEVNATCARARAVTDVYYIGDDTSSIEPDLTRVMIEKCPGIKELDGVLDVFDPCRGMKITQIVKDDEVDRVAGVAVGGAEEDDDDTSALVFVAMAGLGLAFLVLLLFAVIRRRGRDSDALKHHELHETDDETYLRDVDATFSHEGSPSRDQSWETDDDERYTGLNGRSPDAYGAANGYGPDGFGLSAQLPTQDVHSCSSALCEICERRRQSGLQFVPVGMPGHSSRTSLPDSASRDYLSHDTVQL